jgi:hypothetical protein
MLIPRITEVESNAMRCLWVGAIAIGIVLNACAATTPTPTSLPTATAIAAAAVSPAPSSAVSSPGPDAAAQAARDAALRDASTHLGVNASDLRVERIEPRQWPDASLGCPRPGVLYAQVVTPGYLLVISGGSKTLEYHTDERGRVALCQET